MRSMCLLPLGIAVVLLCPAPAAAQNPPPVSIDKPPVAAPLPAQTAASKSESPDDTPAGVEIISGDELRARGAATLRDALALAAGINVAPIGDAGPAAAVPEILGLSQFDAFLVVVDGTPWGGAFSPAVATISLRDVERIEIQRGAAPVGDPATSFSGVIRVVHKPAAFRRTNFDVQGGSLRSGGVAADLPVEHLGTWLGRVSVDFGRQGFADDRTSFARGHSLFRLENSSEKNKIWISADLNLLRQSPGSPQPLGSTGLSGAVPIDANANPDGAFMNDNRFTATFGLDRPLNPDLRWTTTASFSHSGQEIFRGFLTSTAANAQNNAAGVRENIQMTDVFVDSHLIWPERQHVQFTAGVDFLHGQAAAQGATFTYSTPLDGSTAAVVPEPTALNLGLGDRREFAGVYGVAQWHRSDELTVTAGLRANVDYESQSGGPADLAAAKTDRSQLSAQPTGSFGVTYRAWQRGANRVNVYGTYRGTFKPAPYDFGLGQDAANAPVLTTILSPETSQSLEGGVKAHALNGRLDAEANVFRMDLHNLVSPASIAGLPGLEGSGKTMFQGFDASASATLPAFMTARATYSFHDGRYADFTSTINGVATQLDGNRVQLSARQLLSAGWTLARPSGVVASVVLRYTGSRFLDERNSILAPGFATLDCGGGYRMDKMELRFDLRN